MTNQDKDQLWNCIMKMRSMPWKKPRGGEYNWDYRSMRELFEKLVVYGDNQQTEAAWRLLNSGKYKYMIYPWYKSQLYNCITFTPPPATYQIAPASGTIIDGNTQSFTVTTTNVPDGTVLYWTILPVSPSPATSADFVGGVINGSFFVTSNTGGDTINTVLHTLYTPNTNFAIQIRTGSISGPVVDTSGTFTIDRGIAPLRTIWDDILNVPVIDPTDVTQWQTFYDAVSPGSFGVTFSSVVVTGTIVDIYPVTSPDPYGLANAPTLLFANNFYLIQFVDFGGWISLVKNRSLKGTTSLRNLVLPGPIVSFGTDCLGSAGSTSSIPTYVASYPTCTAVDAFAFTLSRVFKELYIPNATSIGIEAFRNVAFDVFDMSGFINTGALNLSDYIDQLNGSMILTVDQSWQSQVITVSFIDNVNAPIVVIAPVLGVKFVFNNATSIQYDLGATSTGTYDFTAGVPDVLLYTVGGPDLTPFSTTYFYEITGTGITQADFVQPTSLSGTFIPTSSATPFTIEPDISAVGKSFMFSIYQGTSNAGPLVISRGPCNII